MRFGSGRIMHITGYAFRADIAQGLDRVWPSEWAWPRITGGNEISDPRRARTSDLRFRKPR